MSKKEHEIIAQIVGHKSLKITGGLRLEIDIPDIKPEDVAKMVILSINKAHVKIKVSLYDKEDHKEKEPRQFK